jgi:hypothetical protein
LACSQCARLGEQAFAYSASIFLLLRQKKEPKKVTASVTFGTKESIGITGVLTASQSNSGLQVKATD